MARCGFKYDTKMVLCVKKVNILAVKSIKMLFGIALFLLS